MASTKERVFQHWVTSLLGVAIMAFAGYYFFLKNSITILNERQNQIKEKIEKLEKCAEKAEEHQNKIDNILTRLKTCVENIKRELDRK